MPAHAVANGWRRMQALRAVTTSPWTRDLRHVGAVFPRAWSVRFTFLDPSFRPVRPQDRVRWWNVVPGDQVRVRGAKDGGDALRQVYGINRLSNRVLLTREQVRVVRRGGRMRVGGADGVCV